MIGSQSTSCVHHDEIVTSYRGFSPVVPREEGRGVWKGAINLTPGKAAFYFRALKNEGSKVRRSGVVDNEV